MPASTRTPILTLADLESFDERAARGGTERVCRCPICQGDESAFHFNTETGAFNCKRASCRATGKLADFWQERPRLNRQQRARNALNAAFSLTPTQPAAAPQNAPRCAFNRETAAPARTRANTTEATWQGDFEMSRPLASTRAAAYLESRGLPASISEAAGVRALRLYGRECALFPFCDRAGVPVAFQARAVDGLPDGHRASGQKKAGVFAAAPDVLCGETVIVCEAPIDALSLAACGFGAVALGGVAAPSWLAAALAFKRVLLAFDNDANGAGDQAAASLAPDLQKFGAKVARLSPCRDASQEKSDWNAMLLQSGAGALRSWLASCIAHIGYFQFGENYRTR